MVDVFKVSKLDIDRGVFSPYHTSILKVCYINGSPLRFEYFTCRSRDSAIISQAFCRLSIVKSVQISTVDNFKF